ncbi:flagellar assembly protein FliW [Nocardioides ferulae]|uniref:flagellar assembly protein FliW n=1 Tax=Nocardioides ferulae TaxID=2340821 RepID=UPI001F0C116F|nr:flagellar assembly protein FliW [Nocardioides ferulae]
MTDPQADPAATQDLPLIEMVRPMVGFPEHKMFALVRLGDDGVLTSLTSVEDESLRFLVMPPGQFFPDYALDLSDDVVAELEIADAADVLVLVVLTAGATLVDTTANLIAPVVVNVRSRKAAQVVLDDSNLPVAATLVG